MMSFPDMFCFTDYLSAPGQKLENKYTVTEILNKLRDIEMVDTQYNGYIPAYKRTRLTDELHTLFGFRTDYEIVSKKKMRNIIKKTKQQK